MYAVSLMSLNMSLLIMLTSMFFSVISESAFALQTSSALSDKSERVSVILLNDVARAFATEIPMHPVPQQRSRIFSSSVSEERPLSSLTASSTSVSVSARGMRVASETLKTLS